MRSKHSDLTDKTNRAANAFKVGLRARAAGAAARYSQQAAKRGRVERIAVKNEVLQAAEEAVAGVDQVPRELRHPHVFRVTGDAGDLHGARLELHGEEDAVPDQAA